MSHDSDRASASINLIPQPSKRRLRAFAFDPQASVELDTAPINNAVVDLPWEASWEGPLEIGPVNDYLEVVDYDPVSRCFYPPVDLNDPLLLAQSGLMPSDGNPQFHQQMVFAVAMKTIRAFERALGRVVVWVQEPDRQPESDPKQSDRYRKYIRRLRIYPHAMRGEANAYYSPRKTALLFGYFRGAPGRDGTGGGWVFTCLSQDIIVHETTHAILHGMWPRSIEACNGDALAFHEAFADLVALFQHFTLRSVIEHQIARSGGAMRSVNLLSGLAQQFGRATGREGPLRFALQMLKEDERRLAERKKLEPNRNAEITEPHKRGGVLVAAVFDAFVTIFERRTDALLQIARHRRGSSTAMSAELTELLAIEAEKSADRVLRLCIRGLDYLPPVDVTFGEYLRAILTADADLYPDDTEHYRVAFAEAFHKRGIAVPGQYFTSVDTLLWDAPEPWLAHTSADQRNGPDASFSEVLPRLVLTVTFDPAKLNRDAYSKAFAGAKAYEHSKETIDNAGKRNLRDLSLLIVEHNQREIYRWLTEPCDDDEDWEKLLGIFLLNKSAHLDRQSVVFSGDKPSVEVHSVRIARRQGFNSQSLLQLVVQVTQRRRGYFNKKEQGRADTGDFEINDPRWIKPDFWFRGGATLLVDLNDGRVRVVIRKRIDDDVRLARQRAYLLGDPDALTFTSRVDLTEREPFAFMHRSGR